MTTESSQRSNYLALCVFLVSVNLLAGFVAITFNYPSLYNVNASFNEYAMPLNFNWALAHWPSMFLYGTPLLFLGSNRGTATLYYRLFCVITFGLLLLELDAKIPFLLFPRVDAVIGLVLSLALLPPNRKTNPVLFPLIVVMSSLAVFAMLFLLYGNWQHRTPSLSTTIYAGGVFELSEIDVDTVLHEMRITMELKERIEAEAACELAQRVASEVVRDYPFDESYNRFIELWFGQVGTESSYPLGEISLNEGDRNFDGGYACYLRYR